MDPAEALSKTRNYVTISELNLSKLETPSAPPARHKWGRIGDERVCAVCSLRLGYRFIAGQAGGRAVMVAGGTNWMIFRKLPPCPTTRDTPIKIAFAR